MIASAFAAWAAAFRFLTIIPLPGRVGATGRDLGRSLGFFPLVGLVLGLFAAAIAWLASLLLPMPVAAVMLVLALACFSGGLHLDGLADTADGFFSARPKERILAIMRDSRIGAMGVLALIMLLALKITALASLNRHGLVRAALAMPVLGRAAIVLTMAMLPYARKEGGLASLFYDRPVKGTALSALAVSLLTSLVLFGSRGMICLVAWLLLVGLFARFCRRKIAGATGDTLGAVCELSEALLPLVLCLLTEYKP